MFAKKNQWGKVAAYFTLGALTGAIAGAATALLLTPFTGKKMQKKFAEVVEDQVENVEKLVKRVVNA